MPDIFDEVDEELRADRARAMLRRYGVLLGIAMLLTLAAVGVYTWWSDRQQAETQAVAARFFAAQQDVGSHTPDPATAATLADIAAHGPSGYQVLARLNLAVLQWNQGKHEAAIAQWAQVSADPATPPLLRDLAIVTSVQHQIDTGDASKLKAQLGQVLTDHNRWTPVAEQLNALLDLKLGRQKEAVEILTSLAKNPEAPQAMRQMASDLLIALDQDGTAPHG